MPEYTSRLALPKPDADNSESPAGPAQIGALADALDIAAIYSQGILADKPVSTPGSPGISGRFYYVIGDTTPANNGVVWLDYGTGWIQINSPGTIIDLLANIPAANTLPSGSRFFAEDQVAEYLGNGTAWTRMGDQPGEVTICLEATADPGHILLQGQAWPATTGIYADLYAKFGGANLPDLTGAVPVGYKASDADFGALLALVGEKKHTLTTTEIPAHTHTDEVLANSGVDSGSIAAIKTWANATGGTTRNIGSAGGGLSHNNIQPSRVVNFQAKL